MKIVVIGGSGLIGSKLVSRLQAAGHEALAASPNSGVNTLTGEGLAEALARADVVVDVANSPSFEDGAVLAFFETSSRNLLAAEAAAGVRHHVALSVVGTDRLRDSGYMRAKVAQEALIRASGVPYTILHSTQFFEFLGGIAHSSAAGEAIHLSTALFQPIAANDVADALAAIVVAPPVDGMVEVAGPAPFRMDALVRRYLADTGDARGVIGEADALYFGARIDDTSLMPALGVQIGATDYNTWFAAR
jgi:uncharacterized protein YbjT (DUF2867 family)